MVENNNESLHTLLPWAVKAPTRLRSAAADRDYAREPLERLDPRALVWELMRRMVRLPPRMQAVDSAAAVAVDARSEDAAFAAPSDNEPACPACQCVCYACSPRPLSAALQERVEVMQARNPERVSGGGGEREEGCAVPLVQERAPPSKRFRGGDEPASCCGHRRAHERAAAGRGGERQGHHLLPARLYDQGRG